MIESEVTQACPTLCDPMDCSLPGSSIHGIFQARVLEWRAIAFSIRAVWYLLIPNSKFTLSPTFIPFDNHKFVFYVCESISAL